MSLDHIETRVFFNKFSTRQWHVQSGTAFCEGLVGIAIIHPPGLASCNCFGEGVKWEFYGPDFGHLYLCIDAAYVA